jgi:hypothetical protein
MVSGHYALRSKGLGFPLFETLAFSQKKKNKKKELYSVMGSLNTTKKDILTGFFHTMKLGQLVEMPFHQLRS